MSFLDDFPGALEIQSPTLRQRIADWRLWAEWLRGHRRCDYCDGLQSYGDWKNLGSCHACWNEEMERIPPEEMS